MASEPLKPVRWIGSSRDDVKSFPQPVRRDIGQALYAAQKGQTDPAAKPLKGFGGGTVLEIVTDHRGGTWRSVYTVRFRDAVYVLHAFQKKARSGISAPKRELDLIRQRLSMPNAITEQGRIDHEKQSPKESHPARTNRPEQQQRIRRSWPAQPRTGIDESASDAPDLPHHQATWHDPNGCSRGPGNSTTACIFADAQPCRRFFRGEVNGIPHRTGTRR